MKNWWKSEWQYLTYRANKKSEFKSGWDDFNVSEKMVIDLEEVNKRKLTSNPIRWYIYSGRVN